MKTYQAACVFCGKTFTTHSTRQEYCSEDCKAHMAAERRWMKAELATAKA